MATPRVRTANSAAPSTLAPLLPREHSTPLGPVLLSLHLPRDLTRSSQDALYSLFDSNISPLARGTSMETAELAKREEMFDRDARFLVLCRERAMPGSMPRPLAAKPACVPQDDDEEDDDDEDEGYARSRGTRSTSPHVATVDIDPADLLGYASFRFDTEETMGPKDVEVVYCYELQLMPAARGLGLGRVLMKELERIGRERGMRKSMLTCLSGNTSALGFYAKTGYTADEIDPTRIAEEDGWEDVDANGDEHHCDYRILSKSLK